MSKNGSESHVLCIIHGEVINQRFNSERLLIYINSENVVVMVIAVKASYGSPFYL